jgi:glutathione S-transferase
MLAIAGRSSSHFTRTVRIFALELGVTHAFRPIFDLMSPDAGTYAQNPALKVPILVTPEGPWFGAENICRELARRAPQRSRVVLRGDVSDRLVGNAEELTLQAMTTEVSLIMAKVGGDERMAPPKMWRSLEGSLGWLDENVDRVLELLPQDRAVSFFEVTLFCLVTHLPFREVMDVRRYERLAAYCERFADRDGARQTQYRYDVP